MSSTSRTDWSRIDAMTDDDIDTSDIQPLSDDFFAKAKLRMPSNQCANEIEQYCRELKAAIRRE